MDGVENREEKRCRVRYSPTGLQISEVNLHNGSAER
jgi:hypothetical protein